MACGKNRYRIKKKVDEFFDDSDEEWYTVGAKTDKDGKSVTIIVRDIRGRMVRKCMCSLTLL